MGTKYVLSVVDFHPLMMPISIVVEFAKESRPRRDNFDGDRGGHGYRSLCTNQLDLH